MTSPAPTWNVGLVGCGWIGGVAVDALRALHNAQVVACCASSLESAQAFAEKKQIPQACADYSGGTDDHDGPDEKQAA